MAVETEPLAKSLAMPNSQLSSEPPHLSPLRLTLLTCAMAGVQVAYAAQVNLGTPHLLLLGLPHRLVSYAWLAGPLSGLIVQPLIGRLSDRTRSRFGRRRPYLLFGSLLTALAMLIFSNATAVAAALRIPSLDLALAIFSFFLLDFSVQAVQAPLRALVTDIVPTSQRPRANAMLGVFTGAGLLLAGALTGMNLVALLPGFSSDVQALFAISAMVLVTTVALSVVATSEKPAEDDFSGAQEQERWAQVAPGERWEILRGAPAPFWGTFAVQLCTWVGFFTLFVYVTSWVGHNVYLGDGNAPAGSSARETFERGVRLGGRANAVQALVTILYALILPELWKRFGVRVVYVFGQLVEACVLLSAPLLRGRHGQLEPSLWLKVATVADIGSFGIVWATTMSVPWTLVGDALESDPWYARNVGLFQTIFNASQSGPQLIVAAALAPLIMFLAGDDPSWVMFSGGVFALLGAVLVIALRVHETPRKHSADTWWTEEQERGVSNEYG